MIVVIFVLAVILLLAGFAGLISAINLVPTDLGFTYFQAGATAISAGCVVLALGLAVKVLNRSLQRLAMPEPVQASSLDPVFDLSPLPPATVEPAQLSGKQGANKSEAENAPERSLMPASAIAGSAAAVAAGAIVATSWSKSAEEEVGRGIDTKLVDELEHDLFSRAEVLPELPEALFETSPVSMPVIATNAELDDFLIGGSAPSEPVADQIAAGKPGTIKPVSDTPGTDQYPGDFEFPLPDFALRPALEARSETGFEHETPAMLAKPAFDTAEPAANPSESAISDDVAPKLGASGLAIPAPDSIPTDPILPGAEVPDAKVHDPKAEAPAPPPAPGLIHDADFAAVADQALPPLAPISSLDVIGAYDSGGTRFTMYSDGSVVAAGPEGERRFRSLDELRQHIDSGLA